MEADTLTLRDVDVPAAAPAAPAPAASQAVEKTAEIAESITGVHTEVAKFDAINAGLLALEQAHPLNVIVAAIDTPAGMRAAETAWRAYRNPRLEVEKARKSAKAPVLALGRAIDAFAGQLEARLTLGETHYKAQITAEETRRAAVKAEAERKERERVEGLQAGIAKLRSYVERAAGQPAEIIQRAIDALVALGFVAEDWQEFVAEATTARDDTVAKLRDLHTKAVEAEAQRAEAERLRVLAEQQAAELAALRAREAERQAAERAAQAAAEAKAAAEAAQAQLRAEAQAAADAAIAAAAAVRPAPEPITQDAQESGSSPADVPAAVDAPRTCASNAAESAEAAPSGDEGPAAHADTSAADPAPVEFIKLGDLCAKLGGLSLTAAFIAETLGVQFAKKERAAIFYTQAQAHEIKHSLLLLIEGADL